MASKSLDLQLLTRFHTLPCLDRIESVSKFPVVAMSFRPEGTDYEPTGQVTAGEGDLASQWDGVAEHEVVVEEIGAVYERGLSRVTRELDAGMLHSAILLFTCSKNCLPVGCIRGRSTDFRAGSIDQVQQR